MIVMFFSQCHHIEYSISVSYSSYNHLSHRTHHTERISLTGTLEADLNLDTILLHPNETDVLGRATVYESHDLWLPLDGLLSQDWCQQARISLIILKVLLIHNNDYLP